MIISNPLLRSSVFVSVVCSVLIVIVGCSTHTATTYNDSKCQTRLTGYYNVDLRYLYECPAIVISEYGNYKKIPGKIVSIDSTGVIFNASEGYFKNENKFYKMKQIACVVDSNSKAIVGSIPAEFCLMWETQLTFTNLETNNKVKLWFEPNKQFDLCMAPGMYKLSGAGFVVGTKYSDLPRAVDKDVTLEIIGNKTNLIGSIYFDTDSLKVEPINFDCVAGNRQDDRGIIMLGTNPVAIAVGAVVTAASLTNRGSTPSVSIPHTLKVIPPSRNFSDTSIVSARFILQRK